VSGTRRRAISLLSLQATQLPLNPLASGAAGIILKSVAPVWKCINVFAHTYIIRRHSANTLSNGNRLFEQFQRIARSEFAVNYCQLNKLSRFNIGCFVCQCELTGFCVVS